MIKVETNKLLNRLTELATRDYKYCIIILILLSITLKHMIIILNLIKALSSISLNSFIDKKPIKIVFLFTLVYMKKKKKKTIDVTENSIKN